MANIRTGRRSGLVFRGGKNVRQTFWIAPAFTSTTVAPGTPVIDTSLNAAALALRPFTIVRVRGVVVIASDQQAATEAQMAAYGEAVVSEQASAIGVTAVPTPVADGGSDLFYVYQLLLNRFKFVSSIGFDGTEGQVYTIDSKAMRKVEDGQDVVGVIEASATGNGTQILVSTRLLVKLH